MLGFAYQKGQIPITGAAIERAIELNAVAADFNKQAFLWGRRAAQDLAAVERIAQPPVPATAAEAIATSLHDIVRRRVAFLTDYQDAAYARRYEELVRRVERAEAERAKGMSGLAEAVARYAFKLMAYKDEYEVARLYTDGRFLADIARRFEGDYKLEFHLAPPLSAERDDHGHLKKKGYGAWMLQAFRILKRFKWLRGTALDPFGRTEERRMERQLIADYVATVEQLIDRLDHDNHALAVEIAEIPEHIRGFGHVKDRHLANAKAREAELLARLRAPQSAKSAAE